MFIMNTFPFYLFTFLPFYFFNIRISHLLKDALSEQSFQVI